MSRLAPDGTIELWWVDAIADKQSPTPAEINGGTRLTPWLARDSWSAPETMNTADASDVEDRTEKKDVSTIDLPNVTAVLHRDSATASDGAWDALEPLQAGYLVYAPFGLLTEGGAQRATRTALDGDRVEVRHVRIGTRTMSPPVSNQTQRFQMEAVQLSAPATDAVVANPSS